MKNFLLLLRVQLLKDIRSQAWLLILLFVGLVLRLTYQLDVFAPELLRGFISGTLGFVIIACGLFITVRVIMEDSPVQRERFLATRPMPATSLAAAKIIFLLLFVLLPFVAFEALYLWQMGLDGNSVFAGCAQTGLLAGLGVAICAVFTTRCFDASHFSTAIGTFTLIAVFYDDYRLLNLMTPVVAVQLGLVFFTGLGLLHLIPDNRWRSFRLLPLLLLVIAVERFTPWRNISIRPETPIDPATIKLDDWSFEPWPIVEEGKAPSLAILGKPPQYPAHKVTSQVTQLSVSDGQNTVKKSFPPQAETILRSPPSNVEPGLARAVRDHFEIERLAWFGDHYFGTEISKKLDIGELSQKKDLSIDAEITFHMSSWQIEAILPLQQGATGTGETGAWKISWQPALKQSSRDPKLNIQWWRKNLWLSSKSADRNPQVTFVIINPNEKVAWHIDNYFYTSERMFEFTSLQAVEINTLEVKHELWNHLMKQPAPYQFVILRNSYAGSFKHTQKFDQVDFPLLAQREVMTSRVENIFQPSDINLWLSQTGPVTGEAEVSRYLNILSEKVERCKTSVTRNHAIVEAVARLVPDHLPLILKKFESLPFTGGSTRALYQAGLVAGLREDQKDTVIAALTRAPRLLDVVEQRGWLESARQQMQELTTTNRHGNALRLLASIARTEANRDWLLEHQYGLIRDYEKLRDVPGLAKPLDQLVHETWRDIPAIMSYGGKPSPLLLAALQSNTPGALECLLIALRYSSEMNGADKLDRMIENLFVFEGLSGNERYRGDARVRWLLERDPESFRFDPISRRYVLSNTTANQ